jgi:hypothetical protein
MTHADALSLLLPPGVTGRFAVARSPFDVLPMTQHVEVVAVLVRGAFEREPENDS